MPGMMRVKVEYYAAAKALVGIADETLAELPGGLTVDSFREVLVRHRPVLGPHLAKLRLAVNDAFAEETLVLRDGDVVGVLPPLAGGSGGRVGVCEVSSEILSVDRVLDSVRHPGAGGIALFVGVVRDNNEDKAINALTYEAHPRMALTELRQVLETIAESMPNVRVAAAHRVGALALGDAAVIVAASAPHRDEAFEACRAAIDAIKEHVPIWKHEFGPEGDAWVRW